MKTISSTTQNTPDEHFARIVWRSRRGMLELDLALTRFVREHYQTLPMQLQLAYDGLLTCEDPYLYQSIVLGKPCLVEHYQIVQTIRTFINRNDKGEY